MTRNEKPPGSPDTTEILQSIGEAAYEWRIDTDAIAWSPNAGQVLGVADATVIATGRAFAKLVDAKGGVSRFDAVCKAGATDEGAGVPFQAQYGFSSAPGAEKIWLEDSGRWFAGSDGAPAHAHGIVRVITERHERERQLAFHAQFDALTGEFNRARLVEMLASTLDEATRFRSSCGFLLIAVDNLDRLNEGYGFDVADQVLAHVAKRIRARLRGHDTLGRHSGNKFGVILKNCTPEELITAAERLLAGVREETIPTAAGPVAATVTIGGVTAPRHARDVEEVLSRAHEALEAARHRRQGTFNAYHPNIERDAFRRESLRTSDEIVAALNDRRVALAYEPVVEAASRRAAFYECLLRVQRADGSVLSNHEIVPAAERLGLIRLLDHRVLELVVENMAAAPKLHCSVNVSPESAADPEWLAGLTALLRAHGHVAERLIVELTETAAIHDVGDTRGFVTRLKDLGCRIAMDDFGAGYTSFRNLRKLGVDIVKIDGAYVQNMIKSPDDRAFVHTLIDLARRLGLKTVAEWVQNEETADALKTLGCDYLQGALIGLASQQRPEPIAKSA
ncbi:MAG TPA: bifunctional diguanylate cyclase/phosphodiesterase [Pseudolabrys sp.]|nr:bifunctional diguanylate cyclase/phosphodiesterase [Pseudolabrys sp.]